jgi:hypothetical protein
MLFTWRDYIYVTYVAPSRPFYILLQHFPSFLISSSTLVTHPHLSSSSPHPSSSLSLSPLPPPLPTLLFPPGDVCSVRSARRVTPCDRRYPGPKTHDSVSGRPQLGHPSSDKVSKEYIMLQFFFIYYPMLCLFPSALSAPSLRLYLSTIFLHYPLLLLSFPSVPLPSLSSFYIPLSSLILLPLLSLHTSSYHLSAFIRDEMSAVSDHVFSVFVDAACDRLKDPKINSCADNTVRTSCRDVLTIPHFKTFKKCRTNI